MSASIQSLTGLRQNPSLMPRLCSADHHAVGDWRVLVSSWVAMSNEHKRESCWQHRFLFTFMSGNNFSHCWSSSHTKNTVSDAPPLLSRQLGGKYKQNMELKLCLKKSPAWSKTLSVTSQWTKLKRHWLHWNLLPWDEGSSNQNNSTKAQIEPNQFAHKCYLSRWILQHLALSLPFWSWTEYFCGFWVMEFFFPWNFIHQTINGLKRVVCND